MKNIENISLIISLACAAASLIISIISFINRQRALKSGGQSPYEIVYHRSITAMVSLVLVSTMVAIIYRAIQTGHGPFSNMYEFSLAFAFGVMAASLIFRWYYKTDSLLNLGVIIAILLLVFARIQYMAPNSLVPALQQSALLSAHVVCAVIAYGTLTIGFVSSIMYFIQKNRQSIWLPDLDLLDRITYQSVMVGFPFLTLLIILGALWADIAWGKYWSWDPKETSSLATWLIYAAYMHVRILRGWRGIKTNILLIIGFAAIILTFLGNYIFTGLHAYR